MLSFDNLNENAQKLEIFTRIFIWLKSQNLFAAQFVFDATDLCDTIDKHSIELEFYRDQYNFIFFLRAFFERVT